MKIKNLPYLLLLISTLWIIECSEGRGGRGGGSRGSSRRRSKSSRKTSSSSKSKPSPSVAPANKPSAPLKEISLPSYASVKNKPPSYSVIHPYGRPPAYSAIYSNNPPPPYSITRSSSSIYYNSYGKSYGSFSNNNNYYANRDSTSNAILSGIALWELSRNRNNYRVYHVHHHNQNGGNKNTLTEVSNDTVITAGNTYIITPNIVFFCNSNETKNTNNNTITLTLMCGTLNSFEAVVILPSNTTVTIPCDREAGTYQCKDSVNFKEELMKPLPNITKDSVFGIPMCNVTLYAEEENHTSTTTEKTPTTTEDWFKTAMRNNRRESLHDEWNTKNNNIETNTPKSKQLISILVPCIYVGSEQQKLQAQSSIATLQNLDQKTVKALAESAYLGDIYKIFSL